MIENRTTAGQTYSLIFMDTDNLQKNGFLFIVG